eukprot:COSAG02_NODE_267_length_26570_cov_7.008235_9_plen_270_part_00
MLAVAALLLVHHHLGRVADTAFDCQLRELARDYTRDVVLSSGGGGAWNAARAGEALLLVSQGLRLSDECNISSAARSPLEQPSAAVDRSLGAAVTIHVASTGSDVAPGTEDSPLRSIAGAQALIRKRYPDVASRPAITVYVASGDYVFGSAGPEHLVQGTSYSGTALAKFTEHDSGSSPDTPITYTAAPGSVSPPRFLGGAYLSNLQWKETPPNSTLPTGVVQTTVPGNVSFESQDQLFLKDARGKHQYAQQPAASNPFQHTVEPVRHF